MTNSFTLAIIAGGKSSRMGQNKAFVEINGQPLIERIIERTQDVGQAETILITNTPDEYEHLGLPMFSDVVPDSGSLGGIYTAIHHSKYPHTMVIACDMPFVSGDVLRYMVQHVETSDVVVPMIKDYPQGLHAIYSKNCLEPIRERIDQNLFKVIGFYKEVSVTYLDESALIRVSKNGIAFMNINTPDELVQAQRIAALHK